jgi:hypothetical protein
MKWMLSLFCWPSTFCEIFWLLSTLKAN